MRSSCDTASRGKVSSFRSLIQRISQQTVCRKLTSWETTTEVWGYSASLSSSHRSAPKSRWLVGSSSRRSLGLSHNALASSTFMRQPPESWSIGVATVGVEPCMQAAPCAWKPKARRMSAMSFSAPSHWSSSL
mmetsp:Transcript_84529/g.262490  ORF Transcript_84529/g.262490 Transcript_84529/m.262490 type:complete len:133 (+) Transcript_84529:155-553(+)